jgi:hypothetical protein
VRALRAVVEPSAGILDGSVPVPEPMSEPDVPVVKKLTKRERREAAAAKEKAAKEKKGLVDVALLHAEPTFFQSSHRWRLPQLSPRKRRRKRRLNRN